MTDSKTREAFEAWFVLTAAPPGSFSIEWDPFFGVYMELPTQLVWDGWRGGRLAALEEAALVAERSIGAGACTPLEEYRAGFIADEIRALADETREG